MPNVDVPAEKQAAIEKVILDLFPEHSVQMLIDFNTYSAVFEVSAPDGTFLHRLGIPGEWIDDNTADELEVRLRRMNLRPQLEQSGRGTLMLSWDPDLYGG